jgi:hypothetical protein
MKCDFFEANGRIIILQQSQSPDEDPKRSS